MSFIITSCLGGDDPISYSPDATIRLFWLDTIHGVTYRFTIDQERGLIYNEDSLPVDADTIIDKILIDTLVTSSGIVTMKTRDGQNDSLINLEDSMDFRSCINAPQEGEYMKIKVYAPDMLVTKEYNITVRVHKQDPDSLKWQYMGKINDEITGTQRAAVMNRTIYTLASINGQVKVYRNAFGNETGDDNWYAAAVEDNGAFNGEVPTSLLSYGGKLYATSATSDGTVYESSDGVTWSASADGLFKGNVSLLLAPLNSEVTFIREVEGKRYFSSTRHTEEDADFTSAHPQEVPANFPISNLSYTRYSTVTNQEGIMLVGNIDETSGESESTVPWGYMGDQWIDFSPNNSATGCPKLEHPSIIFYNDQFCIFGAEFEGIYVSKAGIAWSEAEPKFTFPKYNWLRGDPTPTNPDFRGRMLYAAVQDTEEQYIYILFSAETGVHFTETYQITSDLTGTREVDYDHGAEAWRGRLNQLWFDLANASNQ